MSGFQAASVVDERDERDLVDPVDSENSQVGIRGINPMDVVMNLLSGMESSGGKKTKTW